jgi:hypothetical protein
MRRLRRFVLLAALVAVSGCGDGGGGPDVAFTADVTAGEDGLDVSYRVTNESDGPVLVLNRVPVEDTSIREELESEPDRVYVTRRDGGLVEVAKRTFEKPDGLSLFAPFVLEATVLGPGATLEESLAVPFPLEGRSLYPEADDGLSELPDEIERVVFCVGVVEAPEGAADGEVARIEHGVGDQRLLCSDEVDLPGA